MTKPTTAKQPVQVLDKLSLKNIFPFNELSDEDKDDTEKVNQAYRELFQELIPGFHQKQVQFVLAEVLEIDRKESASRLLVYSDLNDDERNRLISEYKGILNSLKDVSPVLISESDAFYRTSRIWCAETKGDEPSAENKSERAWGFPPLERITQTSTGLDRNRDIKSEELAIESIFRVYVERLHAHHLGKYPFAYVLLVPIFLNSIFDRQESLKKLGAVFLHFTTTKQVAREDLQRIYGRTLLFWHYYFTSEAIDTRQLRIQQQEARAGIYEKIEPFLKDIRKGFRDIRQPLRRLEIELNPVKGLFDSEDAKEFFSINGRTVKLSDDLPEISPRHAWIDGDVDAYKKIVAGVLIRVLHLEPQIPIGGDLWESASGILCNPQEPVFKELLNSIPGLKNSSPDDEQVKRTYSIVKSWFSDSYKREAPPGLPLDMLVFGLKVMESDVVIENSDKLSHFWVASRSPVETIDALGVMNAMYGIKEATINLTKSRSPLSKITLTSCELKLTLSPTVNKAGSLRKLSRSLSDALRNNEEPRGDMTKFLWRMGGENKLSLIGTKFIGQERKTEGEVSIDFMHKEGAPKELLISWRGRIYI